MRQRIPSIALVVSILLLLLPGSVATAQDGDGDRMTAATFRGLAMRNIGPGLMSGRIADIEVHPEDPNTWYVAVGSGGVWKTVDRGLTFTPIFDDQSSYSTGDVAIDPGNPETIWVGTGENVSGRHVGYGDGIYKSTDGGASWTNKGLEASEHIGKIIVHPDDSDVVFVAAEGPLWSSGGERGLYRTTDGGVTWEAVLEIDENTGVTDVEMDPTNPDVLYAAAYERRRKIWALLAGGPGSGIYKSTDGGDTWREVTRGLPGGDMGKINVAVSPIRPSVVYATVEAHEDEAGFYRSDDRGESWERRNPYHSGGTGPHYYQEIYASPHVFDRVYQADVWMHVTDDGGRTFRRLGTEHKHSDNHALAFVEGQEGYLIAGTDGGLYESWNLGESWRHVSNLAVTQFYKMALDDAEPFYNVIGGTQDNGTIYGPSRNTSANGIQNRHWLVPYGADGYATGIDPEDPNILYVTWQNGHLLRYDKRTGEALDIQPQPGMDDPPERWNWDAPLELSPHDPARIYYGSQRLWRSDDRGNSWTAISGDLTRDLNRYELPMVDTAPGVSALYDNGAMSWYGSTTAVEESPLVEGLIYVGTDDGLVQVTEDGGETWREIGSIDGVPEGAFVNDVMASVHDPDTVTVAFDHHKEGDFAPYLVRSTDRGASWESIAGDLPERHVVWSVVQDHEDPDLLFAGTEFGIYFTVDGGGQWIRLEGNVPTIPFRDIEIQRRESDLVGASFGRGFFVLDDYSALRGLSAETLEADARLFPVRDAIRFVPSSDLGIPGRGYQGATTYMADNPPFGAIMTVWIREAAETARETREAREESLREEGDDVPFPGWEALRRELRERDPFLLVTVTDAEGNVVRRVTAPDRAGLQRISWDLRYPSPRPIELEERELPPWANDPVGPLVMPGTYTASLARVVDGEIRDLGQSRSFQVLPWTDRSLPPGDRADTLSFQRRTAEVQRLAMAEAERLGDARDRVLHMREAVLEAPEADSALLGRIDALEDRLADIAVDLLGDRVRGRLNEPSKPSVLGRVGQVSNHWWTTEPPTATQRDSLYLAGELLHEVATEMSEALRELQQLEDDLEEAHAPYTPGRGIQD